VVSAKKDNYEALKEICEQHCVRRLDLHSSTTTGEEPGDEQGELNILVEYLPREENEILKAHLVLEHALGEFFGREIGLLRIDDIKLEWLRKVLTRRRTMLYCAEDQDES
jgi:predicted nucleotidyltransferase